MHGPQQVPVFYLWLGEFVQTGHFGLPFGAMAEGLGTFGVDTVLYPKVTFGQYVLVLLTIVFTSLLASLYPTRLILKKPPHAAMAKKL